MNFHPRLTVLFLFLFLSACVHSTMGNAQGVIVDTSNWKTHAAGRFLVALPPDAQVEFTAQIWKTDLEWRKDLTPESAQAEIQKKIAHYKSIPHELIDGTQFIDTFSLSGGGGVVQHWARAYDDNVSLMECYFVSQDNKKRVYYYAYEVGKSSFAAGRKDVEEMAKTFYARDDWDPLPTEPGYAFPGGFSKHSGEWRAERAILAFNSPSYPGIAGYFACYSFGKKQGKMFDQEDFNERLAAIASKITILQKGDCVVNGYEAQELCAASTENGRRMYNFDMEIPCQGKELAGPQLILHLFSKRGEQGNGFTSDKEAIAVWNAIRDSIRLRPGAV